MSQVITFSDFTPTARFDSLPWTDVLIEEGATVTGPWTEIDTQPLSPLDVDPSNPATRSFTTELASDDPDLWYRITFLDSTDDTSQPTVPIQNTSVSVTAYATVSELKRILKIRVDSAAQDVALNRVLLAAAGEIDSEIDRTDALTGWELHLATEVNLERAIEHWKQQEVPWGLLPISGDAGAVYISRDSWDRHALKLQPLKQQWGIA